MRLTQERLFLYAPGSANLSMLVQGMTAPPADTIEFTEPGGGEAARELAIPLLAGMDEVRVLEAELRIRGEGREIETHDYTATACGRGGVFLRLNRPGRLRKVTLRYMNPVATPGAIPRLIIRAGEGQGGPPLFASPAMAPLGSMYGPLLAEFMLTDVSGGRLAVLPSTMGVSWLFQVALGDSPDKLVPQAIPITIVSVVLDAVPSDVALSLVGPDGELTLWSNPGMLLPSVGEQIVSFAPLAQRHLTGKLRSAVVGDAALPVSLKFRSSSAGVLEIRSKRLRALYVKRPLASLPKRLELPGDRATLTFEVPAGLTPVDSSLLLTVKSKGRQRDAASPESPDRDPVAGLVASGGAHLGARMNVSSVRVVISGVRVLLGAPDAAEAVIEVRSDVVGSPGRLLGKPGVQQLSPAPPAWIDFEFPEPVVPDSAAVWVCLRTTHGSVSWFGDEDGAGTPRTSYDQGASWGVPDSPLGSVAMLLVQLMTHGDAGAPLVLTLRQGPLVRVENLMNGSRSATVSAKIPTQLLAAPPALGNVEKRFDLASATVGEAVIEDFTITYDPEMKG